MRAKPSTYSDIIPPRGRDIPLVAPHVALEGDGATYMGTTLDVPGKVIAALGQCDGERPLGSYRDSVQSALVEAARIGLVCWLLPAHPPSEVTSLTLVVSPHPDDAVLSLGAWLCDHAPASVVNIFSVETWARQPYYLDRPEQAKRLLVQEDRNACRIIGACPSYLGFSDAPLRGIDKFMLDEGLAAGGLGELGTLTQIREAIAPFIERCTALFAPAGVGGHVDHLVCREAVLQCIDEGLVQPGKVYFYEELPYAVFGAGGRAHGRLEQWCRERGLAGPFKSALSASEFARSAKADALACYRLQLTSGILRRVMAYGARLGQGQFIEQVFAIEKLVN